MILRLSLTGLMFLSLWITEKEKIEEITLTEVANFNRCRAIIKDGLTSNKDLIQLPYISEEQHFQLLKHLLF